MQPFIGIICFFLIIILLIVGIGKIKKYVSTNQTFNLTLRKLTSRGIEVKIYGFRERYQTYTQIWMRDTIIPSKFIVFTLPEDQECLRQLLNQAVDSSIGQDRRHYYVFNNLPILDGNQRAVKEIIECMKKNLWIMKRLFYRLL